MGVSKKDAYWILNAADLAASACETINEANGCDVCPLRGTCLEESDFVDVAYSFTASHWEDFLALADDMGNYVSDEDAAASYADHQRKADVEERMIDGLY